MGSLELTGSPDNPVPIEKLQERYADKLNDYYESNGINLIIQKENILFTDWMIEDNDTNRSGLAGVNIVKEKIKEYLIKYNVFKKEEEESLLQSLSKIS